MKHHINRLLNVIVSVVLISPLGCYNGTKSKAVPTELEPFVYSFFSEASKRGKLTSGNDDGLIIQFGRVSKGAAGSCKPNLYPKVVTIDSVMWNFLSFAQREILVFHELAHCVLNRSHKDEKFAFGECRSWMREADVNCRINTHNAFWRDYYINELFLDDDSPSPKWYDTSVSLPIGSLPNSFANLSLKENSFTLLDQKLIDTNDWLLRISTQPPDGASAITGIALNELMVEWSFLRQRDHYKVYRSIILRPHTMYSANNVIWRDTVNCDLRSSLEISLRRKGQAVYLFFERDLKACLPIPKDSLTVGGYTNLREDKYVIGLYRL